MSTKEKARGKVGMFLAKAGVDKKRSCNKNDDKHLSKIAQLIKIKI